MVRYNQKIYYINNIICPELRQKLRKAKFSRQDFVNAFDFINYVDLEYPDFKLTRKKFHETLEYKFYVEEAEVNDYILIDLDAIKSLLSVEIFKALKPFKIDKCLGLITSKSSEYISIQFETLLKNITLRKEEFNKICDSFLSSSYFVNFTMYEKDPYLGTFANKDNNFILQHVPLINVTNFNSFHITRQIFYASFSNNYEMYDKSSVCDITKYTKLVKPTSEHNKIWVKIKDSQHSLGFYFKKGLILEISSVNSILVQLDNYNIVNVPKYDCFANDNFKKTVTAPINAIAPADEEPLKSKFTYGEFVCISKECLLNNIKHFVFPDKTFIQLANYLQYDYIVGVFKPSSSTYLTVFFYIPSLHLYVPASLKDIKSFTKLYHGKLNFLFAYKYSHDERPLKCMLEEHHSIGKVISRELLFKIGTSIKDSTFVKKLYWINPYLTSITYSGAERVLNSSKIIELSKMDNADDLNNIKKYINKEGYCLLDEIGTRMSGKVIDFSDQRGKFIFKKDINLRTELVYLSANEIYFESDKITENSFLTNQNINNEQSTTSSTPSRTEAIVFANSTEISFGNSIGKIDWIEYKKEVRIGSDH